MSDSETEIRLSKTLDKLQDAVTDLRIAVAKILTWQGDFEKLQADVETLKEARQQGIGKHALLASIYMAIGGVILALVESGNLPKIFGKH
jgi:hypothetical protein